MIETVDLTRSFQSPGGDVVHAVRGIDLRVSAGETVAVLGPNGAGKSTLMRMLSTLLPPTSGRAKVVGHDVSTHAPTVRQSIGYVGQGSGAGQTQRAVDEVVTQGRIYGLDRAAARHRASELLSLLGLEHLALRKSSTMSGGQRRRLDLAMGLVHTPSLLILDEPTTGLDPQNRANLWDHITAMRNETGMTVLVTTHYLDEADLVADRIVIVDHGQIVADGTPTDLKERNVGDRLTLETADRASATRVRTLLNNNPGTRGVTSAGQVVTAQVKDGRAALPAAIAAAQREGIVIAAADTRAPSLDDVFLQLTGRSLRDAGTLPRSESDRPSNVVEDSIR
ncbi:ATP-binding cassette domain-containing protein [Rhodococcus sp. KRD162]|uniref:ATP-binding cassette domain-containing protein n=1 Tax=Rhodococcus sp. KRD162 TaxID=2729725 RepID=UPI0019D1F785|nr:ATP-binding cassette domain-containing protein [Rhodococcus sp. KRD162]